MSEHYASMDMRETKCNHDMIKRGSRPRAAMID